MLHLVYFKFVPTDVPTAVTPFIPFFLVEEKEKKRIKGNYFLHKPQRRAGWNCSEAELYSSEVPRPLAVAQL